MDKNILTYLNQMVTLKDGMNKPEGFKYGSAEEFYLANGKEFKSASLDTDKYEYGKMKECYTNAFNLAVANPELTYCEGISIPSNIPMPIDHAWCVDKEGNVVDNTWSDSKDCSYYGVPFEWETVRSIVLDSGYYGIMYNYQSDFKILKNGI